MNSSPIHKHLQEAWKITLNGAKIRHFNFAGSLIDTLILSGTLIYQIGFVWLDIMHMKSDFFSWVKNFATNAFGTHKETFITGLVIVGVFYFLANFLLKNMFNAGLISLIRAYSTRNEREYRTMSALTFGWKKSVKLTEYHSLLFWSKPVYIFYIFFWGYRLLDNNWGLIFGAAGIFLVALTATRFFFEYARYYIVINNAGVFESLGLSLTMTIEHLGTTLRIFCSLLFVYFRELILLIAIFFLPFLMSWFVALGLGPIFLQGVFIIIGLVYFIFLIIVSAMNAVVELFVESLWYNVFMDNLHGAKDASHGHHHDSHTAHH